MVLVGDEDEINNAYRKPHRIKGITILDSFSHTFGFERERITKY